MDDRTAPKRWGTRTHRLAALWLALALTACSTPGKEPPAKPFIGTLWLVALELPLKGEPPSVRFGDGRMEGFGGCGRIEARFVRDTVGAGAITLGRIERGRRATCDRAAADAEDHVVEVMQSASSYAITGDAMTMTGSAGMLTLRAAPAPAPVPAPVPAADHKP